MARFAWAFLVVTAVLVLLVGPGQGQEGPVELRLKLTRGDILYYAVNVTGEYAPPPRTEQFRFREAVRILETQPDGTLLIEVAGEDLRNPDGSPLDELAEPYTFKVRLDGRVTELVSGRPWSWALFEDFPNALPPRSIASGETWSRPNRMVLGGVALNAPINGTLDRVERAADGRVARLRIRIEGRGVGRPFSGLPPGLQAESVVTFRRMTDVAWSIERGRMIQEVSEELRDYQNTITVGGQPNSTRAISKVTTRRQALLAESIVVPSVAAGFLIVPGKGIGRVTLDLPMGELTSRLGAPAPVESPIRMSLVKWPNGLLGYLDPADQNRLLGLQIGDRRYLTEKGIGLGSSQGAVLFGYGMAPTRASVLIPKVGTVTVLIYDDQGVAFFVIGQRARDADSEVPPIGTVLATVVFTPGGAGKILSVP
jgi:hypothetical protein